MYVQQIRDAVMAAPRARLPELSAALWKGYGAGAIGEADAQQLAELIEARKAVPVAPRTRRSVGTTPRTPASLERRRRWAASGWLPPALACRFTLAELSALAVVAEQVTRRGDCRLTLGAIAGLAGCSKTTCRNAFRRARDLGLITVEEWRLTAWRSAPNCIRIVSREWSTWLRLGARRGVGAKQRMGQTSSIYQKEPKPWNGKPGKAGRLKGRDQETAEISLTDY